MTFREQLGQNLLFFDGGMGTTLQQAGLRPGEAPDSWNLRHPEVIRQIHLDYLRAGAHILTTNSFGSTARKLAGSGCTVRETAAAATRLAREAIAAFRAETGERGDRYVAFDVGPTGALLRPVGDLDFEEAVALFAESIEAGAGEADLILIETMTDCYELKAAVLAAKEHSRLPICATVAPDLNGKLLTGGDLETVVALLEGLGVDAIGLNCGFGPAEMLPLFDRMRAISSKPLILTPNAGLPRQEGEHFVYDVDPETFAHLMREAIPRGAQLLGGCCGTTPEHIRALVHACGGRSPRMVERQHRTVACSYAKCVLFDGATRLIGESINPTGRKRVKEALRTRDFGFLLREGSDQQAAGADLLDVNAGLPEIDEPAVLTELVERLQAVTDLPLQLDTADPEALARAMRRYNGKPMVNSVNGKRASMEAVFPLVAKYGGLVVALTLDEAGIPETPDGRIEIAKRIIQTARGYGIHKEDLIFDALTMTVSAGSRNAAVTLETVRRLREELGVRTILGVSNVSFGLPERPVLNAAMLSLAMGAGLDAAIINPRIELLMNAFQTASTLLGRDEGCQGYLARFGGVEQPKPAAPSAAAEIPLDEAIGRGLVSEAAEAAKRALAAQPPLEVIDRYIVPALTEVGDRFEKGTLFLPQLMMSADAAKAAFAEIRARMGAEESAPRGEIVIATVAGDVHDIGKNIVGALLENYRFRVIDLGKDVPPERVVEAVRAHHPRLVGLSALMTTTVPSMVKTIEMLHAACPDCRVMVGGAVLTADYASRIGADFYAKDAMRSVHIAEQVYAE